MQAKLRITTTTQLEGTFDGETLAECVAFAELEARKHSELVSQTTLVLKTGTPYIDPR